MPVESRHFLLNVEVAGRVFVLRQIACALIDNRKGAARTKSLHFGQVT